MSSAKSTCRARTVLLTSRSTSPSALTATAWTSSRFKGSIETLLHELRITDVKYVACTDNDSYHPGRCAKVYAGETYLGVFGQIHPLVAANYGMDTEVYTAELSFDAMYEKRGDIPVYQPLPKFPAVTRDIAVVCDEAVTVGALEEQHPPRREGPFEGCVAVRYLPRPRRGRRQEERGVQPRSARG